MKKTWIAFCMGLSLLFFTGFRGKETSSEYRRGFVIPEEKRKLLKTIAGRWITQTNIHARDGKPASKVIGSDIWQWSPDGNFLLHTAYGIRDGKGFGGMEITGYNEKTGEFNSYVFNPDGTFETGSLSIKGNIWTWLTKEVRTIGIMDEKGNKLTVTHEITSDGKNYSHFMDGVLTRGSDY